MSSRTYDEQVGSWGQSAPSELEEQSANEQRSLTEWGTPRPSIRPTSENDESVESHRTGRSVLDGGAAAGPTTHGRTAGGVPFVGTNEDPTATGIGTSDAEATGTPYGTDRTGTAPDHRPSVDPLDTTWFRYALGGFAGAIVSLFVLANVSFLVALLGFVGLSGFGIYSVYRDVSGLESVGVWNRASPTVLVGIMALGVLIFPLLTLAAIAYYGLRRRSLTKELALERSYPRPMQ